MPIKVLTAKVKTTHLAWLVTLIAMATLLVLIHLRLLPYADDDAYIHLRIAKNFAQYGRPYFNGTEAVNASSSPGWTLILAMLYFLQGPIPISVSLLNAGLTFMGALVHARLLRTIIGKELPVYITMLFGVCYVHLLLRSSIGLMETPFAMFILGLALQGVWRGSQLGLLLLGALVFLRFEFVLFLLLVLIYAHISRLFSLWKGMIWSLTGALPFLIYEFYFYGWGIPNTIIAKARVYDIEYGNTRWVAMIIIALSTTYFIMMFKAISSRASHFLNLLMVFGLLLIAAYVIAGAHLFPWYIPIFMVPLLYGLFKLIFLAPLKSAKLRGRFRQVGITVLVLFGSWAGVRDVATLWTPSLYEGFMMGARVRQYIQVGFNLYNQCPTATLLAPEIGGLGYGFQGYIADGVGLATPTALKYHPMAVPAERRSGALGALPVGYAKEVNPEFIVSNEVFVEAFMRSTLAQGYIWHFEPAFLESDLRLSNGRTVWNNSRLVIFIRKDIARDGCSSY